MGKNYIQLEIGGQMRGLKFNNRTINLIGDLVQSDPLEYTSKVNGWSQLLEAGAVILHAALLSNCASKKAEPDFTKADIDEWVLELGMSHIYLLVDLLKQSVDPSIEVADWEGGANTQEQKTFMATA